MPAPWSENNSNKIEWGFLPSIIATALTEKRKSPDSKIIVVSRDINMRVKCDSFGLKCEDYQPNKAVKSVDKLFDGMQTIKKVN